jgi:transcriptional regulator with XRE-family HTH domain
MSLRTLAGLSGLSVGFLSMVENGRRHLDRTGHINALAEALQVAPAERLGQPYPPAGPASGAAHEVVPAIRLILMGAHPMRGSAPAAVMPTSALAERVSRANRLYHACEYGTLAHALPDLLADLHAAVAAATPQQRPGLLRLTAQAYYPACTLLLKSLGYTDLAFLAVTRATDVTAELDDPLYRALSGFFHTHVLMAAGSPDQAYAHAEQAADLVETNLHDQTTGGDRAPLALLGELHLIRATALTQQVHRAGNDRTNQVHSHLREAHTLAARTGETRAWHLNFGPTNVGIHQNAVTASSTSAKSSGSIPSSSWRRRQVAHRDCASPGKPGQDVAEVAVNCGLSVGQLVDLESGRDWVGGEMPSRLRTITPEATSLR